MDSIILLRSSVTTYLINVLWLYNRINHMKSILDLHFFPTKINANEAFSYFWKNNIHIKVSFIYVLLIMNMSQKEYHTREKINWFICIPKITIFYAFVLEIYENMLQYPNPGWMIYAQCLSSLEAVFKVHCLHANAVMQPSVQHCPCYMVLKTKVHTRCWYCHLCIYTRRKRESR